MSIFVTKSVENPQLREAATRYASAYENRIDKIMFLKTVINLKMIKEIQLTNENFELAVSIIQKQKNTGKLSIQMNRKTYGGLITLNGNSEEIEWLCSILQDNGVLIN